MSATLLKETAMKILHKIATVLVTLLLYFVIVILQTPKAARADEHPGVLHAGQSAVAIPNDAVTR